MSAKLISFNLPSIHIPLKLAYLESSLFVIAVSKSWKASGCNFRSWKDDSQQSYIPTLKVFQ